jgi:hypothetical protein
MLSKYFGSIVGPRPFWIPASEWPSRQTHFRPLIEQLGQTGEPPAALVRSIRRNESAGCDVSKVKTDKKPARAPWYLEAQAEWARIKKASRTESTRLKRETRRKHPRKAEPAPAATEPVLEPLPMVPVQSSNIGAERRTKLEQQLRDHPALSMAFDVANAPAQPESGAPVSVARAYRQGDRIVVDEVQIPREQFDPRRFVRQIDPEGGPG